MFPLPQPVQKVLYRLESAGYEAYLVGGCVRDFLLGESPKDYDITTSALPRQTEEVFADLRVIETGLSHGTVTVLAEGLPVEITTYRVDGDYRDNRHPSSISFAKTLKEDVARRDFTMNAIACDRFGGLRDFFGGEADILHQKVRCVGDPEARFREDGLRILRALRFSATLGFSVEPQTQAALFTCKALLRNQSAERVAAELRKLLCGKAARRVLLQYGDILAEALPELSALTSCGDRTAGPWARTSLAVERIAPEPALRLAALCHRLGLPQGFAPSIDPNASFPGGEEPSATLADALMARLKLDNATRQRVATLVRAQGMPLASSESAVRRALHRLGPAVLFDWIQLKRAIGPTEPPGGDGACPLGSEEAAQYDKALTRMEAVARRVLDERQCFTLKALAVNGEDLLAMGVPPGKRVGDTLHALLAAVMDGTLPNDRQALLAQAKAYLPR